MLPTAATEFYATQQRVNAETRRLLARLWRRMGDDLDGSWRRLKPDVLTDLVIAQQEIAGRAERYVPRVLDQTNIPDRPEGDVRPMRFVGYASDGRPLETLVDGAVVKTKQALQGGATTAAALSQGGDWLQLMTALQIADVARQVVGVMTASRKNLGGTVRVLNPPSCQRCAILAGRFYRWSTGFERHPRCDCVNSPVPSKAYAEAEGFVQSPMEAYRNGEITDLTEAQRFAIDNGADIGRVVNATRGMSTTATKRSLVRKARRFGPGGAPVPQVPDLLAGLKFNQPTAAPELLTPEGIYQQAAGDRDEAIRLLRHWGFIT